MLLNILDIVRIVSVAVAFFFGYQIGFSHGYDPIAQLHFMIPVIIISMAGLSGLEGIFFARKTAELKGFEVGSNYQRQSAIALLSYAATVIIVYVCDFGIKAELAILFAFIFFLFFSGINHGVDAIRRKNYKWQNINRPVITLLLIIGLIYPVIKALQSL
jgi:hypothetical protein